MAKVSTRRGATLWALASHAGAGAVTAACASLAVAVGLGAAALVLIVPTSSDQVRPLMGSHQLDGVLAVAFLAYAAVGALIVVRRPDNRVGWIFLASGLGFELWVFAWRYAAAGLVVWPGSLPTPELAAWLAAWVGAVDVRMPPTHTDEGLVAAIELRGRHPDLAVLVLSHHVETHQAVRLLADRPAGVGYLLKDRVTDLAEFADAVTQVGSGGSVIDPEVVSALLGRRRQEDHLAALTPRELEVLALMAEGRTNQAIGDRFFLGTKTVESHVASIFTKLGLLPAPDDHRRVFAVVAFLRSR